MEFDTDFWSEIQDAPGEIFDIEMFESWDDDSDKTWKDFINSDVTQ
jgi:hypothetical protein